MIYKLEKDVPVLESNVGLKTNELFADCTDRELRYIFLLYDLGSPYIKMGFKDRKEKAALEAGYRKEKDGKRFDKNARHVLDGKSRRVNAAIQEFKQIQLAANTNYAVLAALKAQIDRTVSFLETTSTTDPGDMLKINKLATELEGLIKAKLSIEKLLDVVDVDEEEEQEEVNSNLSMLDQMNVEQED